MEMVVVFCSVLEALFLLMLKVSGKQSFSPRHGYASLAEFLETLVSL